MAKKTKDSNLSIEERLEQALIPNWDEPYELPENWCWTKIGTVTNLYRGVSYKKHEGHAEKGKDDCLVMRGGNIQEGKIDINADNIYVSKELISNEQYIRKHDVVIVSSTGSTKVIGRAGISFADYDDVAFGAFLTLVRPVETVYKPYISYYFQSDMYRNRMRQLASGVNINNIRNEYITDTPFPMPPLEEQKRIVSYIESLFAKLDEAQEKAQEVVDGFETRKASILHKAFSGELTAKWREENSCSLYDWADTTIGAESILITKGASPRWQGISYVEDKSQTLFITSENVREGYLDLSKEKYLDNKINEIQKRSILKKGDVLVNIVGASIGRAAIFDLDCLSNINQAVCLIRVNSKVRNEFLCYFLNSPYAISYYNENKVDVARANVSLSNINKMPIILPALDEQDKIIEFLNQLLFKEMRAKEAAESVIEQIDTIKKAILARAFRGEFGTNDPKEATAIELIKQIIEEKIKTEESTPKRTPVKRKEVSFVAKTILEVLKSSEKLTPEKLKSETALEIDDFYDQLKFLINNEQIREIRIDGESYLEAVK